MNGMHDKPAEFEPDINISFVGDRYPNLGNGTGLESPALEGLNSELV